jgi:hypothetical protein
MRYFNTKSQKRFKVLLCYYHNFSHKFSKVVYFVFISSSGSKALQSVLQLKNHYRSRIGCDENLNLFPRISFNSNEYLLLLRILVIMHGALLPHKPMGLRVDEYFYLTSFLVYLTTLYPLLGLYNNSL